MQFKKIKKSVLLTSASHPTLTAPKIDKIALVVDMEDKALHGMLVSVVLGWFEEKDPAFIKGKWSARYPLAVSILCPNADGVFDKNNPAVLLQATKKNHPKPQVRLEFNPSKLFGPMEGLPLAKGNPCAEYLDTIFNELCGVGFFEFLYYARVTSVDVCREILGCKPDEFLFKVKYAQIYQSVFGNDGELETLYFGAPSGNQTRIYNKGKELGSGQDSVRIEVRQRFKNFKIADLWGIPNPFSKVGVFSLTNTNPPYGAGHWVAFQDACRFRGIGNAIKLQPKSYRNKLKKAVSALPVLWWLMMDADWEWLWADALAYGGLNMLPDNAPPLTMENASGSDCLQKAA
jgi:hypothetical protein